MAAGTVVATDYADIAAQFGGNLMLHTGGPTTTFLINPADPGSDRGVLTVDVYEDQPGGGGVDGTYVYVMTVQPTEGGVTFETFNANFDVIRPGGADPEAGHSFSEATTAGLIFNLTQDPLSGSLSWQVDAINSPGIWTSADSPIHFFFRDPRKPGLGEYALINGGGSNTDNLAPVPEPGTWALMGLGLLGLVGGARRRRKTAAAKA
jgi:hypothetical protein